MQLCGFSLAPLDAHQSILDISDFTLSKKGGDGVVRDLVENIFKINPLDILFK
jgi:3-deoxy-D-manno-octulosonate 8-phosphate phosphatase KdsC-like HAD superfamily phosphatase